MSKQSKNKKATSSEEDDWDAILEAEIAANKAIKGSNATTDTTPTPTTTPIKQEVTPAETVQEYFIH